MEIPCIIQHVITRKENGFAILAAILDEYSSRYVPEMKSLVVNAIDKTYETFTVVVDSMDVSEDPVGGQYVFVGEMTRHPRFGYQFKSSYYYQDAPSTEEGLRAFLMTMPGVKKVRSRLIIEKFGLDGTIEILNETPSRLSEIPGITDAMVPAIKKEWDDRQYLRKLYEWFSKKNIDPKLGERAFQRWKHNTVQFIEANPYILCELRGIGFVTGDQIAHKISDKLLPENRVAACMEYVLREMLTKQGHLCVLLGDKKKVNLKMTMLRLLEQCDSNLGNKFVPEKYLSLVAGCIMDNPEKFTAIKILDDTDKPSFVYLTDIWQKECFITNQIVKRAKEGCKPYPCSDNDVFGAEHDLSVRFGRSVKLDDKQVEAIQSAFEYPITVITGAGGTGKSAICRCIYYIAGKKGLTVRMMSPTGKAAQVLSEKTGGHSATIHRSLKLKPGEDIPDAFIGENILIVDEISMSGVDTMFAIMTAMRNQPNVHVVFVGDKNQLPSVSPGNFLSDIMNSKCANVVMLDKIHRQSEDSYIPIIAGDVSIGKVVDIPDEASDMTWHDLDVNVFHRDLVNFVKEFTEDRKMEDLQIISPMKKGPCGVYALNEVIQEYVAESSGTKDRIVEFGFNKFYVGDRVIQLENNYEKSVFNGDIGHIVDVGRKVVDPRLDDKSVRFISVEFCGGGTIDYVGEEFEQLALAWVITVHKFQGSSSPHIVFVMSNEAKIMMSKELVYTALTRAERHIDIFGHEGMWRLAPTHSVIHKRYTNMQAIIRHLRTGKTILVAGKN